MKAPKVKIGDIVRVRRPGLDDIDALRDHLAWTHGRVVRLSVLDMGEGWQPAEEWHGSSEVLISVEMLDGSGSYGDLSADPANFARRGGLVALPPVEHCALCGELLDLAGWSQVFMAPDMEQRAVMVLAHNLCVDVADHATLAPGTSEGFLVALTTDWRGRRWPHGTNPTTADLPLLETLRRQRWTALEAMCCERAAHGSAERCSCWVPVYDRRQAPPRPGPLDVQPDRCADCACRPDSLEAQTYRDGVDRGLASSLDGVMDLARRGVPFFCHEGMRRIRGWYHPLSGRWLPLKREDDYAAPMVGGVAYRADGRPALVCAGWMSFRRAHLEAEHATDQQHFFSGPLGLPYTPGGIR